VRGHKSTLLLGDKTFKVLPKLLWDCDAARTGYCTTNADVVQTEAADAVQTAGTNFLSTTSLDCTTLVKNVVNLIV